MAMLPGDRPLGDAAARSYLTWVDWAHGAVIRPYASAFFYNVLEVGLWRFTSATNHSIHEIR
jgi:hypothetical protein